ncbi:MAG TPA: hypothetical protein VM681_10175 [Candidatus Thermoplasmatota archaeon]|nr:hypothetical protein [Candidatus Thermoplasmatota archaeon]
MALSREVAWRVFAQEFNASSSSHTPDAGERSPTYVVSPLGARVNRLFLVGVLTSVERLGQNGEVLRARVSDPTGSFNLYAGQYQPAAARALSEMQPPLLVAVSGKSRLYTPESGVALASVRPESIRPVPKEERDRWVLETVKLTRQRIAALEEALAMSEPTADKLVDLGYPGDLAEGVVFAAREYGPQELVRWKQMLADALCVLLGRTPERAEEPSPPARLATVAAREASAASDPAVVSVAEEVVVGAKDDGRERNQDLVSELVVGLDEGKGAPWEGIVAQAAKSGLDEEGVEEAINALLDKGILYEPVLGRLKRT